LKLSYKYKIFLVLTEITKFKLITIT